MTRRSPVLPAYRHAGEAAAAAAEVVPEGGAPVDPTAAAFFDVDNTVMRGASIFHFAVGLARRRFFDARQVVDFGRRQLRFVLSAGPAGLARFELRTDGSGDFSSYHYWTVTESGP